MQPSSQLRSNARNLLLLFSAWMLLYGSFTLLSPPLFDDADSVHAEVAREMLQRHDWVTLYANGIRYLEKAPILYWSNALSFQLFGVHTFAARIPLALFTLALLVTLYFFARQAFRSDRAGLYAAFIALSSFGVFIFTRILIPDAIVCLWLTLAVFFFWITEQQQRPTLLPCLGFAAACALNLLTKGLIGIVFPVGIVVVYLLLARGLRPALRRITHLHWIPSLALFTLIAAPWHLLAARANPTEGNPLNFTHASGRWTVALPTFGNVHGWAWFYFLNEHLFRYLNLRVPRDYDTVPLLLFWGLMLVWLMPWSAFLFKAFAAVPWRNAITRKGISDDGRTRLLLAIWALLPLLFFSLSTRQEYYVLPALPAFALLIAAWLQDEAQQAEEFAVPGGLVDAGQRIATVLVLLGCIAAVACAFFLVHSKTPSPGVDLASLLSQNPGDYALSFGHFLDLNAQAMGSFRIPLGLTLVAVLLGVFINRYARSLYQPHVGNVALAGMSITFLLAAHIALTTFSPVLSSYNLAVALRPQIHAQDLVILNDEYEGGSSLAFYLGEQVHILHGHSANLWYGSFFTDAPLIFETDESFAQRWASPRRIFLWTDPAKLPALPRRGYVIVQNGGKEIVSNQGGPDPLGVIEATAPQAR